MNAYPTVGGTINPSQTIESPDKLIARLRNELAEKQKERDEWKAKAEANELDASFWKERAQTNKRDAARYMSEIEMSAKRMFERMYSGLPLGKNGKRFVQKEYDSLCAVLKASREANP